MAPIAHGLVSAVKIGLREHDPLALTGSMVERKLEARRTSPKLLQLAKLVMAHPRVSAGMAAYYLEFNVVVPLSLFDHRSGTPVYKGIPVHVGVFAN